MPLSFRSTSSSRSNLSALQWVCPECSMLLKQIGHYRSTRMDHGRLIHTLRPAIANTPKRSERNASGLRSLLRTRRRFATVQAADAATSGETLANAPKSVHRREKNAGGRSPFENLGLPQRTGDSMPIRSKLKGWQENFVQETSPEYVDQALGGDIARIWRQPYPSLHWEQGDGIFANDTGSAREDEEDLALDEDTGHEDQIIEGVFDNWGDSVVLRPGDLIAMRRSESKDMSVVIQDAGANTVGYTLSGRWYRKDTADLRRHILFHLPGFIDTKLVDSVLPYIPVPSEKGDGLDSPVEFLESAVPRSVGGPVLQKLHAYHQEVQSLQLAHAKRLDNLWDLLAHSDEERSLSIDDASRRLFDQPSSDLSAPALHALTQALFTDYFNVQINVGGRFKGETFYLRSKRESEMLRRVLRWARDYQDAAAKASRGFRLTVDRQLRENPLHLFIAKARRAILKSRSYRSPTVMSNVGPSAASTTEPTRIDVRDDVVFSDTDQDIIKFLTCAHGPRVGRSYLTRSAAATIIRAIGAYPDMSLNVNTGRLFLQEIGVHAPWEFTRLHDPFLKIPGNGSLPSLDIMLAQTRELAANSPHQCSEDMNVGIRKDWGNMVAFRVDSLSTLDHDDAFSLEREQSADDAWWIHVHIADPAAYVPPDHPFAKYATEVRSTMYLAEQKIGMFPPEITARLAVGPNRPVLTFSSLVKSDGEVLDVEVTAGQIRNIVACTPNALSTFLFGERPKPICLSVRGSNTDYLSPHTEETSHLVPYRETLEKLAELAKSMQKRRVASKRPFKWDPGRYSCRSLISPLPHLDVSREPTHSRVFFGDPSIHLEMEPMIHPEHDLDVVGEIMVNTNVIAAKWCRDRGIPIPYMTTGYHPNFPKERLLSMGESEFKIFPSTRKSAEPAPHDIVVADQYTQATSPLRRFNDLLVHWQIRGALSHEYKCGKHSKDNIGLQDSLPFSKRDIKKSIDEQEFFEKLTSRTVYKNNKHWTMQALFRAIHFKEGWVPDVVYMRLEFRKYTRVTKRDTWSGDLIPFGLSAVLMEPAEDYGKSVEARDVIPCKITTVALDWHVCIVVPIGPPLMSHVFNDVSIKNPLKFTHDEYYQLQSQYGKEGRQLIQD